MLISDVLARKGGKVVTVHETETVANAVARLAEHRIGAVAVLDRREALAGIFSERDLVNALAQEGSAVLARTVQERMTSPVVTCVPGDRIDAMLAHMTQKRIRHLPVVGEHGLAGFISIGDLVQFRFSEKELEAAVLLDLNRRHG